MTLNLSLTRLDREIICLEALGALLKAMITFHLEITFKNGYRIGFMFGLVAVFLVLYIARCCIDLKHGTWPVSLRYNFASDRIVLSALSALMTCQTCNFRLGRKKM